MPFNPNDQGDAFSRFWFDMMSNMAAGGVPAAASSASEDTMKRMRKTFFDSWGKCCEEYLGSEQALDAMKQGMDNALAFKQQFDGYLRNMLHNSQMPTQEDTTSILQVLRNLEEHVLDRLDKLTQRVEALEVKAPPQAGQAPTMVKGE